MRPLILLAAGSARRMGEPKALVDVKGQPWIDVQIERFAMGGGSFVCVVVGKALDKHLEALPWLQKALDSGIQLTLGRQIEVCAVENPKPKLGQFSSLQIGLSEIDAGRRGAFVLPIDVPTSPRVFRSLEAAVSGVEAAMVQHEGVGGHPIAISGSFAQRLVEADAKARLDEMLAALEDNERRHLTWSDPTVTMNLNTKRDWQRYLKTLS